MYHSQSNSNVLATTSGSNQWLQPIGGESVSVYLESLGNFDEALRSFAELADSLSPSSESQFDPSSRSTSPASSTSFYCTTNSASSESASPFQSDWSCDSPKDVGSKRGKRSKNASAAEKYRRRLKGKESRLKSEIEREEARNRQLRRQFESKLALYSEFIDLLAKNTSYQDSELANLGLNSLSMILFDLKAKTGFWDEQVADELSKKYAIFKSITVN